MDDKNFEPYMKINAIIDPSPLQLLFYNIVTKYIVLQYAELFYTPLKNKPANAFYESDDINPNYKYLLTPYIDRIEDLDPNDILGNWADIFGYNIDYLKFLELFSRFSIKEVQRIKEGIK